MHYAALARSPLGPHMRPTRVYTGVSTQSRHYAQDLRIEN